MPAPIAPPVRPRLSLLRMSALERVAGVAVLLVALWAAVFWAMT